MKHMTLIKRLAENDRRSDRHVFTGGDLASICSEDNVRSFQATLMRLVRAGVLVRAARDVYVYTLSPNCGAAIQSSILPEHCAEGNTAT